MRYRKTGGALKSFVVSRKGMKSGISRRISGKRVLSPKMTLKKGHRQTKAPILYLKKALRTQTRLPAVKVQAKATKRMRKTVVSAHIGLIYIIHISDIFLLVYSYRAQDLHSY